MSASQKEKENGQPTNWLKETKRAKKQEKKKERGHTNQRDRETTAGYAICGHPHYLTYTNLAKNTDEARGHGWRRIATFRYLKKHIFCKLISLSLSLFQARWRESWCAVDRKVKDTFGTTATTLNDERELFKSPERRLQTTTTAFRCAFGLTRHACKSFSRDSPPPRQGCAHVHRRRRRRHTQTHVRAIALKPFFDWNQK